MSQSLKQSVISYAEFKSQLKGERRLFCLVFQIDQKCKKLNFQEMLISNLMAQFIGFSQEQLASYIMHHGIPEICEYDLDTSTFLQNLMELRTNDYSLFSLDLIPAQCREHCNVRIVYNNVQGNQKEYLLLYEFDHEFKNLAEIEA